MYLSGDWVHPRRMGEIWVDYPPLYYWTGVISSHLLGDMTAFSLRLPNALAALFAVLLLGWVCRRWFDARHAFWAGFALLTMLLWVYEANSYRPDVIFAFAITAGILLYASGVLDRTRWGLCIAGFACLGAAMLAKGPLGLLLPGLVLVLWHAARREWLRIILLAPLALVAIAVYLPWFIATAQGMGWDSMVYEFYAQNFERFATSENRGHAQPWWFYIRNFWVDFLPWSFLFPFAVGWLYRSGRYRDPKIQLALWWFGTFFVFLTLAATKRQLYLLPAYPAVAIILADWISAFGSPAAAAETPSQKPVSIYTIILAVFWGLLGIAVIVLALNTDAVIAGNDFDPEELAVARALPVPLMVFGALLIAAGAWLALAWRRQDATGSLLRIGFAQAAIYAVILGIVMPEFHPNKSYRPGGEWISAQIGDSTEFGMVDRAGAMRRGGFAFYTGTLVPLLETTAEVDAFFDENPHSVVLVIEQQRDAIFSGREEEWKARTLREIRVGKHHYTVVGPRDGY
jgi:4-amino-4-deoxy-L-arabinose transferase-like glycosyltransferase